MTRYNRQQDTEITRYRDGKVGCTSEGAVGWASEGRKGSLRRSRTAVKGLKACLDAGPPDFASALGGGGRGIGTFPTASLLVPLPHRTSLRLGLQIIPNGF